MDAAAPIGAQTADGHSPAAAWSASAGLDARVLRDRAALEAAAPAWRALEREARGPVFFQSLAWVRAVMDFEADRANAGFEPVIATLWEGDALRAALPLERVRDRARTALAPIGNAFAQYADMLVTPGLDPSEALSHLVAAASKAAPADVVVLLKVRADSALRAGLPDDHLATGEPRGAPYVRLAGFADFADYFKTIKPKTRKNMRNARNRLEREGELVHRVAGAGSETGAVIARTIAGRSERLRETGMTSRAFADRAFLEFCERLPGRPDMALLACSLMHDGEPIAEQWGFVHGSRYYAFVASRDFSNSEESPGKLHLAEIVRLCAERGLDGADLMVPVMPYKLTWANEVVAVADYAIPLTLRGRLSVNVWDRGLRPRLKSLALAMPDRMRGKVLKLAGMAR